MLNMGMQGGYVYMPEKMLLKEGVYRLEVSVERLMDVLQQMEWDKTVLVDDERNVYLPSLYYSELNCARMLLDLNVPMGHREETYDGVIDGLEQREKISLDRQQRVAVREAMSNGLLVVTGGRARKNDDN